MPTTVVGLFETQHAAQSVVMDLIAAGFDRTQISVVAADPQGELYRQHIEDTGNLAGEGAATGLTSGAVVGGLLGLLIGAGVIFVPIGILAAGPVAGLIAGGAAGAAAGGIIGGLIGLGIPDDMAEAYEEHVRQGATLVSVQADAGFVGRAHEIMDRDGAVDVNDQAARVAADWTDPNTPPAPRVEAARRGEIWSGEGSSRVRRYEEGAYADYPPRQE